MSELEHGGRGSGSSARGVARTWIAARSFALVLALALTAPASILAVDPGFGSATATSSFGESITVAQRVTLPAGVARVEAYVRTAGTPATFLAEINNPGQGVHDLRYTYETPGGSLFPNTQVELGFRATFEDGRFVDGPPASVRYEDDRFEWRTLEGDLVRIHWYEGSDDFGRRTLEIGDRAVEEATELLGVQETDPIDFYVYAGREAFYDMLGPSIQENVGGIAIPENRTLFANIGPSEVTDPWVSIVVPHELTHLVFHTATDNPYHEPPHWLNEGLADYLAQGYASDARRNVEDAVRTGDLMPLHALSLRFPSTSDRFSLGYDESVSAIDYLIRAHGQEALVALIRSYAGGVADDAAFEAALGVDVAGFEAGWLADLEAEVPVPYGPRPAPVGPLPPGWNAAPQQTGPPVATPPPAIDDRSEMGTTIAIGVIGLFAIVIVLGILVAARGLDRGESLMRQPSGPALPPPARPDEAEPVEDLRELDARFAPPGQPGAGAPADAEPNRPDEPERQTDDR